MAVRVTDINTSVVVVRAGRAARTPLRRLIGLLGTAALEEGDGLHIVPCNGVHTLGMRYAIDVVFLDDVHRVVDIRRNLGPWRSTGFIRTAASVLELPAGTAARVSILVGHQLRIEEEL